LYEKSSFSFHGFLILRCDNETQDEKRPFPVQKCIERRANEYGKKLENESFTEGRQPEDRGFSVGILPCGQRLRQESCGSFRRGICNYSDGLADIC